ncbi:MAG: hypothetical protein HC895_09250 [Leptolyngbyaceae cyanobacterium SM1_3_5]|nr:hypothetical protein [Leptolyngbyaceae cyanobacterium SM1_3_5]
MRLDPDAVFERSSANSLTRHYFQVNHLLLLLATVQRANASSTAASGWQCVSQTISPQAEQLLQQAIDAAQPIGDRRSESFALGELGHLYECQQNYGRALELTREAELAADQALQARDSLYLWQWQTGRIFTLQNQPEEAIRAYEESLLTLDALRKDISPQAETYSLIFEKQ